MPPIFPLDIQLTVLMILSHPSTIVYGTITLYSVPFQATSTMLIRIKRQSTPHFNYITAAIQFTLSCVQSLLLTASLLISFPPVTKTFQFTGLLVLADLMRSRIRKFSVQRLPPPRRNVSQVVTSFISLPSQVFHQMA